jgi:uncharacterized integral membrane protein
MSDDRPVRDVNDMMQPEQRSGVTLGGVLAVIALAIFAIFVFQNMEAGTVTLLWFDVEMPVWLLSVIVFLLGAIFGYGLKARRVRAKRKAAAAKVG